MGKLACSAIWHRAVAPLLQRILLGVVFAIIGVDCAWASVRHFDLDLTAYLGLAAIAFALLSGGLYYERRRNDVDLSAMLFS